MDAPLCKICKAKHWARDPHVGMTKAPKTAKTIIKKKTASAHARPAKRKA